MPVPYGPGRRQALTLPFPPLPVLCPKACCRAAAGGEVRPGEGPGWKREGQKVGGTSGPRAPGHLQGDRAEAGQVAGTDTRWGGRPWPVHRAHTCVRVCARACLCTCVCASVAKTALPAHVFTKAAQRNSLEGRQPGCHADSHTRRTVSPGHRRAPLRPTSTKPRGQRHLHRTQKSW